jgi:hypothetical protein
LLDSANVVDDDDDGDDDEVTGGLTGLSSLEPLRSALPHVEDDQDEEA